MLRVLFLRPETTFGRRTSNPLEADNLGRAPGAGAEAPVAPFGLEESMPRDWVAERKAEFKRDYTEQRAREEAVATLDRLHKRIQKGRLTERLTPRHSEPTTQEQRSEFVQNPPETKQTTQESPSFGISSLDALELPKNVPQQVQERAHQVLLAKFHSAGKEKLAELANLQQKLDASTPGSAEERALEQRALPLEQELDQVLTQQFYAEHVDPQATAQHYENLKTAQRFLLEDPNALRILTLINTARGGKSWQDKKGLHYITPELIESLNLNELDAGVARQWQSIEVAEAERASGIERIREHSEARNALTKAQVEALLQTNLPSISPDLKAIISDSSTSQAELEKITDRIFANLEQLPTPKSTGEKISAYLLKNNPLGAGSVLRTLGRNFANPTVNQLANQVKVAKQHFEEVNNARNSGRISPLMAGAPSLDLGGAFLSTGALSSFATNRNERPTFTPSSMEHQRQQQDVGVSIEQHRDLEEIIERANMLKAELQKPTRDQLNPRQMGSQFAQLKRRLEAYTNTAIARSPAYDYALTAFIEAQQATERITDRSITIPKPIRTESPIPNTEAELLSEEERADLEEALERATLLKSEYALKKTGRNLNARQLAAQADRLQKRLDAYAGKKAAQSQLYERAIDSLTSIQAEIQAAARVEKQSSSVAKPSITPEQLFTQNPFAEFDAEEADPNSDKSIEALARRAKRTIAIGDQLNYALQTSEELPKESLELLDTELRENERALHELRQNGLSTNDDHYLDALEANERAISLLETHYKRQHLAEAIDSLPRRRERIWAINNELISALQSERLLDAQTLQEISADLSENQRVLDEIHLAGPTTEEEDQYLGILESNESTRKLLDEYHEAQTDTAKERIAITKKWIENQTPLWFRRSNGDWYPGTAFFTTGHAGKRVRVGFVEGGKQKQKDIDFEDLLAWQKEVRASALSSKEDPQAAEDAKTIEGWRKNNTKLWIKRTDGSWSKGGIWAVSTDGSTANVAFETGTGEEARKRVNIKDLIAWQKEPEIVAEQQIASEAQSKPEDSFEPLTKRVNEVADQLQRVSEIVDEALDLNETLSQKQIDAAHLLLQRTAALVQERTHDGDYVGNMTKGVELLATYDKLNASLDEYEAMHPTR